MDILLLTGAFLGCSTRIRILNLQLKKGTPSWYERKIRPQANPVRLSNKHGSGRLHVRIGYPPIYMIGVKSRRRHFGNDFFYINFRLSNTKGCVRLRMQPYLTPINDKERNQLHEECGNPRHNIGEIQTRKRMIGRNLENRVDPTNTKTADAENGNHHWCQGNTHSSNRTGGYVH